jgi:hypothetical protein
MTGEPAPSVAGPAETPKNAPRWWRRPLVRLAMLAIALRIITSLVAFLSSATLPPGREQNFSVLRERHLFWDTFARYDSGWYAQIARRGYGYVRDKPNNLAFFPVYPLLMRAAGQALGGGTADRYYFGGILVSWSAFVGAMVLLYRLARLHLSDEDSWHAVLYAAIFPFAFFFGVVYAESVYLFFVLGAFYGFHRRRWILGGLSGAVATATRVPGILALPALAWLAWRARPRGLEAWRAAVGVALVPAGIAAYSIYVYTITGSFFEWADSIARWDYQPGTVMPWVPIVRVAADVIAKPYRWFEEYHMAPYDVLNAGTALAFVVSIPFVWRRFGTAYGLFMLTSLWVPLSTQSREGLGRYCAVLFPFFLWLATFRSPITRYAVTTTFAMFYVLCLVLFTNLYPIF